MKKKKVLALLMAVSLLLGMLPTAALAAGETVEAGTWEKLQEAVADAEGPVTVRLAGDVTVDIPVTVGSGKTVTLDLNGHTLSAYSSSAIQVTGGSLTVTGDGAITGSYSDNGNHVIVVNKGGSLTLSGGTISVGGTGSGDAVQLDGSNQGPVSNYLYLTGASIQAADGFTGISVEDYGCFEMSGGSVTAGANATAIKVMTRETDPAASATVTGGVVNANGQNSFCMNVWAGNKGDVSISGGTFNGSLTVQSGQQVISGGTFNYQVPGNYFVEGYALVDNGDGTFGVTGSPAPTPTPTPEPTPTPVTRYTVTYTDGVEESEIFPDQTHTVEEGSATPAFEGTPAREGFTFLGWEPAVAETVTADATYTARWEENTPEPETYTVTFDPAGGSAVESQTVTQGGTVSRPADPTRTGYAFVNWTLNGAAYDFDAPVTADLTLVAQWEEITYTVTFDPAGGSAVESQTVRQGFPASRPAAPTRSGYTFVGWFLDGELYSFSTPVNGSITLAARWRANTPPPTYRPDPTPDPEPTPDPTPTPDPEPTPTPTPTPDPQPSDGGETGDEEDLGDNDTPLAGRPFLFEDVPTGRWDYVYIKDLFDRELINGRTDTVFDPKGAITRGQLVAILWRMAGQPEAAGVNPFADVPDNAYYAKAILWATRNGLASGYSNSALFGPEEGIRRQDVAAILYRYARLAGYPVSDVGDLSGYADAPLVQSYARQAMAWTVGTGLINGVGGNRLNPRGGATRAEACAILSRFITLLEERE